MSAGNKSLYLQKPWNKTLDAACTARQVDPKELISSLGIDSKKFFRDINRARGPALSDLQRICDYFEITLDSFLTGFIDLEWIRTRKLPEKYSFSAGSHIRTSLPALEYARYAGGEALYQYILRTLKIPRELLKTPDHLVSITLLSDILALLGKRGFNRSQFIEMGKSSASIQQNSSIGEEYKDLSQKQVYEKFFDETVLRYEKNFNYRIIQSSNRSVRVRCIAKPERIEDFGTNQIDNYFVSLYRHGVGAAQLKLAGYPIGNSQLTASLYRGDSYEEFVLDW